MRIGERHCSFSISDKDGAGLYSLAYYTAGEIDGDCLSVIFSTHPELNTSFSEVHISYDYPQSILVPLEHYSEDQARSLLHTMHGGTIQSSIVTEAINEWQLYNIYAVPVNVHEWVSRRFPSGKYRHNYTLEMKMAPGAEADRLLIDIHTDEFSIIGIRSNQLLIAQTHPYSSPEDILFWLLKICYQFSLSREEIQLSLSGLIEKESILFRELYQYFLHVEFREPVWNIPSTEGKEYPAHFFTALNDLARCES